MFIKVIIPKEAQDKVEGCFINSDKITEMFYNKEFDAYLCKIGKDTYQISKEDYEKLIEG